MLNVKDYGARGDGVTDDYFAVQAAANVAQSQRKLFQPPGGSAEFYFPEILFPSGEYFLSQPVNVGGCGSLVADGSVVVRPALTGFKFNGGFMSQLEGFTFMGGQKAIEFSNNNSNGARLTVTNCRFQSQTDYAITALPSSGVYFSSHVTISGCKWFNCAGALNTQADISTVRDCWFQWGASCAITEIPYYINVIGGHLNVNSSMFVPVFPNGSLGHRWVGFTAEAVRNTGAGIFARDSEFHGEYGGLPVIEIIGSPDLASPFQGPVIVLDGTQYSPGQISWPDNGVILCKSGLPQTVVIQGCCGLSGATLIRDVVGDSETIFNSLAQGPSRFRIQLGANSGYPLVPAVPAWMTPYVRNLMI